MKLEHALLKALLASSEPMGIDELAAATELDRRQVAANLRFLVASKLVTRTGTVRDPIYSIPDRIAAAKRLEGSHPSDVAGDRAHKRSYAKRASGKPTPQDAEGPTLAFFLSEAREVQIVRADGNGAATFLSRSNSLRLRAFLNRIAPLLETA